MKWIFKPVRGEWGGSMGGYMIQPNRASGNVVGPSALNRADMIYSGNFRPIGAP